MYLIPPFKIIGLSWQFVLFNYNQFFKPAELLQISFFGAYRISQITLVYYISQILNRYPHYSLKCNSIKRRLMSRETKNINAHNLSWKYSPVSWLQSAVIFDFAKTSQCFEATGSQRMRTYDNPVPQHTILLPHLSQACTFKPNNTLFSFLEGSIFVWSDRV